MAPNENNGQQHLAPPQVAALKDEHNGARIPLERTTSIDMRTEREDLKAAAEQSLNVILDLDLDGTIRWVSPSWEEVVGTPVKSVKGKPIADLLFSSKDGFANAVESMKKDGSKSRIVRFRVKMGPVSVLGQNSKKNEDVAAAGNTIEDPEEDEQILNLEGQGIMVYDRSSGGDSHV